jgi:squalene-hopene/tetraprenyl-beta-curcumene cyclase
VSTQASESRLSSDSSTDQTSRAIDKTIEYLCHRLLPAGAPLEWAGEARVRGGTDASTDNSEGAYWVGELEADTTLESDYIIFLYFLDTVAHREKISKLARTIREEQLEDGGWNIYRHGPSEISASVKAYFALKIAGDSVDDPHMCAARKTILRLGGVEKVNTFTRLYLTFLKQLSWNDIPAIPPEVVLLPRFFYFNIYEISYWSRAILIPLSVLYALKPDRPVEERINISELFRSNHPELEATPSDAPEDPTAPCWRNFFNAAERLVRLVEQTPVKPFRKVSLKKAEEWMVDRSEKSDGLGAIFPSMVNLVMALTSMGYGEDHPAVRSNLEKLRELEIEEDGAIRLQPCLSPVWDTALALNALLEAGLPNSSTEAVQAARWLVSKEVRQSGDWQVRRPKLEASGWYFQFANEFYPDIDDSAAVLMALERVDHREVDGLEAAMSRGFTWILNMQSSDGGWAAFDVDVNREALTQVPYADHNAMLDPTCPDITGRVLESIARFSNHQTNSQVAKVIRRGVDYLKKHQEEDGSWYGRWGVNYVYGTWQSLKGLIAVGEDPRAPYIQKAAAWLRSCQNADGGWGETCESYADASLKGQGASTASQTAWAVMGLVATGDLDSEAVTRGIAYLVETQNEDGSWKEEYFTGTGFPRVFYLKYHLYRIFFPLFALAYYRNEKNGVRPPRGGARVELTSRQRDSNRSSPESSRTRVPA